jgi:uncharacterized protein (DUF2147 family)
MKILVLPFLLITFLTQAQSITGKWKTIDDETGDETSVVEIFERSGKIFGKVIRIFPKPGDDADPVCDKCPEDDGRYNKKIIGMEIIKDMKKADDSFEDGNILDPKIGRIYRCKLWLEGNDLKVRGYWGPFFRTQTWKKVN